MQTRPARFLLGAFMFSFTQLLVVLDMLCWTVISTLDIDIRSESSQCRRRNASGWISCTTLLCDTRTVLTLPVLCRDYNVNLTLSCAEIRSKTWGQEYRRTRTVAPQPGVPHLPYPISQFWRVMCPTSAKNVKCHVCGGVSYPNWFFGLPTSTTRQIALQSLLLCIDNISTL